ncbi:MAG: hypothetical protein AB1469_05020 [Pseudomonadota bacterium]
MTGTKITVEQLRGLIGKRLRHDGADCQIIEVLEDGPSLVLLETSAPGVIQNDQYGEGHRRVAPTFTLLVHDAASGEAHPALLDMLGARGQQ